MTRAPARVRVNAISSRWERPKKKSNANRLNSKEVIIPSPARRSSQSVCEKMGQARENPSGSALHRDHIRAPLWRFSAALYGRLRSIGVFSRAVLLRRRRRRAEPTRPKLWLAEKAGVTKIGRFTRCNISCGFLIKYTAPLHFYRLSRPNRKWIFSLFTRRRTGAEIRRCDIAIVKLGSSK